jgi:hypothetical protein
MGERNGYNLEVGIMKRGSTQNLFKKSVRINRDLVRNEIEPTQIRIEFTPPLKLFANQEYDIYIQVSKTYIIVT